MLANVMLMKSEYLIHMKAKSERLICKRRSLNVRFAVLVNVMELNFEYLIHVKPKSELLICCSNVCD